MKTKILLPGSEFGVKQTSNEMIFNHQSLTDSIVNRTVIFGGGSFGIVDTKDPALVTSTDTDRSMHIGVNEEDPLSININAGVAFTPSGHLITLSTKQLRVPLASLTLGSVNVVFAEYRLVDSDDSRQTRFNALLPVRHESPVDNNIIQVETLTKFSDLSRFNLERLQEIIILGIVTPVAGTTVEKELNIDLNKVTFTNNRPWFSVTDNIHRDKKGTGSKDTPHSLGLNDLSSGDLTLYQQFLEHGIVLSKDLVKANIPGTTLCEEVVPSQAWEVDTTGEITAGSQFSSTKAFYTKLASFPTALVAVYTTGDKTNSIAGEVVPNTNIFVLAQSEDILSFGGSLTIFYLETKAALASPLPINNELLYQNPKPGELIISGGKSFSSLQQTTLSFKDSGAIPNVFRVFVDKNKDFIVNPQQLLVQTRLDTVGIEEFKLTTSQYTTGRVVIGLTKAISISSSPLSIKIELKGTGVDNNVLIEEVVFGGLWEDVTVPGKVNEKQFVKSVAFFKTLESIKVTERLNDGMASEIIVYMELEPFQDGSKFNELNLVSSIDWDGSKISKVKDKRVIQPVIEISKKSTQLGVESETMNPVFNAEYSVTEDFRRPRLQDSENSVLDRYVEGLNVPVIDVADTSAVTVNKYRTRSIGIRTNTVPIQEIAVVLHKPSVSTAINPNSVHARFSGIGEFSVGTITVVPVSVLVDGETFTLDDGIRVVVFEFDNNNVIVQGNVAIDISVITVESEVRDACITAINSSSLDIVASILSNSDIQLTNRRRSVLGNTINSDTVVDPSFVVTNMTNGVSETWQPWEILAQNTDQKFLFSKDFIKNIGKFQVEVFGEAVGITIFFKDRNKAFLPGFGGGGSTPSGNAFFYDKVVTGNGVLTVFSLPNAQSYAIGNNSLVVFVNGLKNLITDDYVEVEDIGGFGTKITFLVPPLPNSKINFRLKTLQPTAIYDASIIADGILSQFTLPAGKTYVVGRNTLEIFLNGAKKFLGDDYTEIDDGAGDGTKVQFVNTPAANAKINFRVED